MLKKFKNINHLCTSFQQEPGANGTEIFNGIQHIRPGNGFVPNFQLFQKMAINGDTEEPLYTFLKVCTAPSVFYLSAATHYKHEDI
jgi:glutathione peroxidase